MRKIAVFVLFVFCSPAIAAEQCGSFYCPVPSTNTELAVPLASCRVPELSLVARDLRMKLSRAEWFGPVCERTQGRIASSFVREVPR